MNLMQNALGFSIAMVLVASSAVGCASKGASDSPAPQSDSGMDVPIDAGHESGGGEGEGGEDVSLHLNPSTIDASVTSACSNAASAFVYVLSSANDLYSFAPDTKSFTKLGTLGCGETYGPNSMAVDRNATAWVNYLDGTIFPVSTTDATCKGPPITLPSGWSQVGMGFSAPSAGSVDEVLYITGADTSVAAGLGRVDVTSGTVDPIGQFTGALFGQSAELTGTGDGRLFGFFATSPVQLAEIDPTNGAVESSTPLSSVQLGATSSFAFSFWGGRFYLYTYPNATGSSTNVTEYDPTSGTVNPSYVTDIGFIIVGAGVSTCAPIVPPPLPK